MRAMPLRRGRWSVWIGQACVLPEAAQSGLVEAVAGLLGTPTETLHTVSAAAAAAAACSIDSGTVVVIDGASAVHAACIAGGVVASHAIVDLRSPVTITTSPVTSSSEVDPVHMTWRHWSPTPTPLRPHVPPSLPDRPSVPGVETAAAIHAAFGALQVCPLDCRRRALEAVVIAGDVSHEHAETIGHSIATARMTSADESGSSSSSSSSSPSEAAGPAVVVSHPSRRAWSVRRDRSPVDMRVLVCTRPAEFAWLGVSRLAR